jgi:lipooligosaccharide transport system ATP-binding protein
MSSIVEAQGLEKKFGAFTAVNGVDFDVRQGECFGLLGPNGAGKSTIINMIYGVARRTGGSLSVFGMDPNSESRRIKGRLGVVTQDNALDESLTVHENMMLYAAFLSVPKDQRAKRVADLLEFMSLSHKAKDKIQVLSGGMRRRLVFVRALLGQPELLILDEPTTGLDPAVRHVLWGKIKELKSQGTTILLTTHYMHEAEILCDRLAILNRGDVVSRGSPQKLIAEHAPGFVGVFSLDDAVSKQLEQASVMSQRLQFTSDSSGIYLRSPDLETLTSMTSNLRIQPLQIRPANLEDVFLKMTGKELSSHD